MTEQYGYVKSSENVNTKRIVQTILLEGPEHANKFYHLSIPSEREIYSSQHREQAESIISYYNSAVDNSEFVHNVKVLLSNKCVHIQDVGTLAYLPFGYKQAMEKIEKERKQAIEYQYYGEVGKRYKDIYVTLRMLTCYETIYGYISIYQMIDNMGHLFIWKTHSYYEPGSYYVAMTIKEHNEYKGTKQTVVTRCKLQKEDEK